MKAVFNLWIVFVGFVPLLEAAEKQEERPTALTLSFAEYSPLSSIEALAKRMGQLPKEGVEPGFPYKLSEESYEVYVPKSYDTKSAFGLLVWISPSTSGAIAKDWAFLMEKHRLIWVGANKSGNEELADTRRIPLALDAAHNMQKLYNIDPNRIYVAGLSGGGRIASMAAMHYSDIFSGGIFIIGANYWEKVYIPGQKGRFWEANMAVPQSKYLSLADIFGRYVFLTGDNDGNRPQMRAYYEYGYKRHIKNVVFYQVPGMGHEKPPADWFEKSIIYLDTASANSVKPKNELIGVPSIEFAQPNRAGTFSAVFSEYSPLSNFGSIMKRTKYTPQSVWSTGNAYKIESVSFEIYVPPTYDSQTPYGLLVFISPGDSGGIPTDWKPVMDNHKLIWVGANKAGNKENVYTRRMPLALDAVHNMVKLYNIDLDRVYVTGISGGGRVSSMTALHYPDIFTGGIFIIGVNYWERVFGIEHKGYWPASMTSPQPQFMTRASQSGRYVLLTGDFDSNREQTQVFYEKGYKKRFKNVLYIQVPKMGHEKPPAEWFEKAIDYLDLEEK